MASRTLLFLSTVVAFAGGCGVLSPPDPRLCGAAQSLSAAMALTATALESDGAGDVARAQGLAVQARSLAEAANTTLDQVPADRQAEATWHDLQSAYGQVGQAAQALLPAFGHEPEVARQSLAGARGLMDKARADLPAMCFDLPAGLETPGSS